MIVTWKGVMPAITTQFRPDQSLDLSATARHLDTMIHAGIHGVVLLGTVGENTTLEYEEKLEVIREMLNTAKGKIPVLTGVAEYTTALASRFARDAEKLGVETDARVPREAGGEIGDGVGSVGDVLQRNE